MKNERRQIFQYRRYDFMAHIDGIAKFFYKVEALDVNGIIADLKAIYGDEAVIEIYCLKEV